MAGRHHNRTAKKAANAPAAAVSPTVLSRSERRDARVQRIPLQSREIPLFKVFMPESSVAAGHRALSRGQLAQGAQVRSFEYALGAYVGNSQVVAVSDRSAALTLALFLSGVRPGDEVIASPLSCLASVMPIANLFAKPVWCDVDPRTGMMDPASIEALIGERTKAVLVYHWGGDVADLDAITQVTRRHKLNLIDDASAAFGGEHRKRRLGNTGSDFTAYSFYAVSHITTGGEGGALFCGNEQHWLQASSLRRFGLHQPTFRLADGDLNPDSDVAVPGFSFGMNDVAAAIGIQQMHLIEELVQHHRGNGAYYEQALQNVAGIELMRRQPDSVSGYWVYSLLAERRTDLMRKLKERHIGCQRLHLRNDRYSCFGSSRRALPGVDVFAEHTLSIPCGHWVGATERERIVETIRSGW